MKSTILRDILKQLDAFADVILALIVFANVTFDDD